MLLTEVDISSRNKVVENHYLCFLSVTIEEKLDYFFPFTIKFHFVFLLLVCG